MHDRGRCHEGVQLGLARGAPREGCGSFAEIVGGGRVIVDAIAGLGVPGGENLATVSLVEPIRLSGQVAHETANDATD